MGAHASDGPGRRTALSRYQHFTRSEWARLRADTPLTLAQDDLTHLRGLNEQVSLDEVAEIYLPLSRLLNLHVGASHDFTIYVDADVQDIRQWYVERFFALRKTAFQDPRSYFHRYADLGNEEAEGVATRIWLEINEPNLLENILPPATART
jgi:pantothenate kinase